MPGLKKISIQEGPAEHHDLTAQVRGKDAGQMWRDAIAGRGEAVALATGQQQIDQWKKLMELYADQDQPGA